LRHLLDRACILADGDFVTERDLAGVITRGATPEPGLGATGPVVRPASTPPVMREQIVRLPDQTHGNQPVADRLPGLSRRTLCCLERQGLRLPVPGTPGGVNVSTESCP
jgi:hypothetical protein